MKNWISRFRAGSWLFLTVSLAATMMTGCASAEVASGVFTVRVADGAVGWIGEPAGAPVWSPTGDSVAWGSEDGLFIRALDESASMQLATAAVAGVPAWSPDGARLAYINRDRASLVVLSATSGTELFTQSLDRSGGESVRFPLLTLGGPSWAPDGTRLAYVCWDGAGDEICVIHADGTRWKQVTRLEPPEADGDSSMPQSLLAEANTGPPAWSPRGDMLAVSVYPERPGAPTGVFLVDLDEGLARRISTLQPNSVIRWFPDGDSILFSAFRRGRSDAFRVVLSRIVDQPLTSELPEGSRNPGLSPNGSLIAVESGGGVVVLGAQGPLRAFTVPGLRSSYPSWSAGGAMIAVAASTDPIASYN